MGHRKIEATVACGIKIIEGKKNQVSSRRYKEEKKGDRSQIQSQPS